MRNVSRSRNRHRVMEFWRVQSPIRKVQLTDNQYVGYIFFRLSATRATDLVNV
jgi:hypothetical protein